MIDMHIHVVPPNLPGVGPLHSALKGSIESVANLVRQQMASGGFSHALAMGSYGMGEGDPLGIQRTLAIAEHVEGLYPIGIADPFRSDPDFLRLVEAALAKKQVAALKAYLGYIHAFPTDAGYRPYYRLAEKYKLPFIFHTGDTYSPYAKLKYAHPLHIDEVAVDHPEVKFVMAHVGNPWMQDAAEVVYKNINVWCDISGLFVGGPQDVNSQTNDDTLIRLRQAFRYAERPNRFLYGSDWPLAPMATYRDFARQAIPDEYQGQVFHDNAAILFGIG